MIASVHGNIAELTEQSVTIATASGISLELLINPNAYRELLRARDEITMYTTLQLRDDGALLFGFCSKQEKALFAKLTSVSGVGGKTALAMLSTMPIADLVHAIVSKDIETIKRCPGIGKKSAQRVALELSDKLDFFGLPATTGTQEALPGTLKDDALSALQNLGYKRPACLDVLNKLDLATFSSFDTLLKESLNHLQRRT